MNLIFLYNQSLSGDAVVDQFISHIITHRRESADEDSDISVFVARNFVVFEHSKKGEA